MMTYQWEWVSDLAIIPAFELFIAGILVGAIAVAVIIGIFVWGSWK